MTAARIATWLLFLIVLSFGGNAHALVPKATQYYNVVPYYYDSPSAFCAAYVAYIQSSQEQTTGRKHVYTLSSCPTPANVPGSAVASGTYLQYPGPPSNPGTPGAPLSWQVTFYAAGNLCPSNSTASGSACACNSGFVEGSGVDAGKCVAPPDPCKSLKGQSAGTWWKDQGDDNGKPMKVGFSACDKYNSTGGGLCVVTVGNGPDTLCVQAPGGYWQCSGPGYYTGSQAPNPSKCTLGPSQGTGGSPDDPVPASPPISENPPKPPLTPAPGTAAPAPCPSGQAPGEFNGSRLCAPVGSDRPTSSGAGSSTTTNNSDGSSTTNTTSGTTTCAQGACNTTTNNTNTTVNAPGNSSCPAGQTSGTTTVNGQSRTTCTGTSSSTSTQPQATFCKDNPKDKQCGGDGSDTAFGGSCAGGYKAVSDNAVLNAMAEEQYRQNCKMYGDPDSKPQVIPKQTKTATLGTVTVGGWGSSCPAPITAVAMGQTFQMSFQSFCDTAPLVRPLVLLACALLSMSIVYSALRGTQ